jgi:hypothetical protein
MSICASVTLHSTLKHRRGVGKLIRSILGAGDLSRKERGFRFPGSQKTLYVTNSPLLCPLQIPNLRKTGREDRVFSPTNVGARAKLKGAERELGNTAVFATGDGRANKALKNTEPGAPVEITHCASGAHPSAHPPLR